MPDNAADRKDIRRREKAARLNARAHADVIREIMSTTQGRQWLWDLLATCHVFNTSFTGDALTTAFAEGERNIGQRLLNSITDTCPDQFIQAMREAYERRTVDERRSSPEPNGRDSGPSDDASGDNYYVNDGDDPDRDSAVH